MKRISKQTVGILLCAFLLCASLPAQGEFGGRRLLAPPAPTLRNRTRVPVGIRRLGFRLRVGGVVFDTVAKPVQGLTINGLKLNYSPTKRDGERLSVVINDQPVSARIYDWQLIPIAKFADSSFVSCFTLFGKLDDAAQQARVVESGGRVLNYHPSFVNTLMGWRLFQLDTLIIDTDSWDLVRESGAYVLGAGESTPDIQANKRGLAAFRLFELQNEELVSSTRSYLISDYRREIVFDVRGNNVNIYGEPSYYFFAKDDAQRLRANRARVEEQLIAQIRGFRQTHPVASIEKWLIDQLIDETEKYERLVGDHDLVAEIYPELQTLLSARGLAARRALLKRQSARSLSNHLYELRILASMDQPQEVSKLSEKVSNDTEMLRAINPTVWDAGVTLMRYAAFFRYCKQKNPRQWALFMSQIARTPPPKPSVVTYTVIEGPSH